MIRMTLTGSFLVACGSLLLPATATPAQDTPAGSGPVARFTFDGTLDDGSDASVTGLVGGPAAYGEGLEGQALNVDPGLGVLTLDRGDLGLDSRHDSSVQFWIRTEADASRRFVVLSQKEFADDSLASQKQPGWVFYVSGGTWAWNSGSGTRRLTYERDNGQHMPLNDGQWHQLTMTHDREASTVRLFYDGENWASYNVRDSKGFEFGSARPVTVGWRDPATAPHPEILPAIEEGARQLQRLVDTFNGFGLPGLTSDEFVHLIVDPQRLFDERVEAKAATLGAEGPTFRDTMSSVAWDPISELEAALMTNPYTVHQALSFMEAAPLMKIYALVDGVVTVNREAARTFTARERLVPPEFDMDNLAIWSRALSPEEVRASYSEHFELPPADLEEALASITTAAWNIFHGGLHFTKREHGWDSREAVAEILEKESADIVMMQETYSSGDFIAAEMGYYLATTVDWDYLNQGSNISVLSRFPIQEVHVQEDSPFMNVGARIAISQTQDLYAMSNWYGMKQFPAVFAFHEARFQESDTTPTLFAGDFNAVPHTDGGDSPASRALVEAGFTDAFRSLHPDAETHPGPTHRSGRRIDQLYYKGSALRNTSTKLVSTWPGGFPSDHYLILSSFDLAHPSPGSARSEAQPR